MEQIVSGLMKPKDGSGRRGSTLLVKTMKNKFGHATRNASYGTAFLFVLAVHLHVCAYVCACM